MTSKDISYQFYFYLSSWDDNEKEVSISTHLTLYLFSFPLPHTWTKSYFPKGLSNCSNYRLCLLPAERTATTFRSTIGTNWKCHRFANKTAIETKSKQWFRVLSSRISRMTIDGVWRQLVGRLDIIINICRDLRDVIYLKTTRIHADITHPIKNRHNLEHLL